MGDEKFFGALNQAAQHTDSGDDWGDLASGWDAVSFEAVLDSRSGAEEEQRLVGDLVGSLFTSYADLANRNQSNAYLDFDSGLAVLCRHAKALGYNAVILFLDELVLWLASRLADRAVITSEIQKVVKLVESNQPRPAAGQFYRAAARSA
jgi:hypothetical protein